MAVAGEGKQVFVPLGEQQEDEEADQSLPTQDKVVASLADDSPELFPNKAHYRGCSLPLIWLESFRELNTMAAGLVDIHRREKTKVGIHSTRKSR